MEFKQKMEKVEYIVTYPGRYMKFLGEYYHKADKLEKYGTVAAAGVNAFIFSLPFLGGVEGLFASAMLIPFFNGYFTSHVCLDESDNEETLRKKYSLKMPWYLRGRE